MKSLVITRFLSVVFLVGIFNSCLPITIASSGATVNDWSLEESSKDADEILLEQVQVEGCALSSCSKSNLFKSIKIHSKNALLHASIGLLFGSTLGGLSYFTYFPNAGMQETTGAGRDYVSNIAWALDPISSLTSPISYLTYGVTSSFGFAVANYQIPPERYSNLGQQAALGHLIDGAIIGVVAGLTFYAAKSMYKHYMNKHSTEEKLASGQNKGGIKSF